ncbi:MAG TPA: hypothetical protein DEA96_00215 [Leptospiraceae bacterium]|nr:hypothetical protein [Spirochaetaceae bacterium]HBS03355.1 hypothetical protein [Leptospiraceae bacterium]|tara:strand:- start:18324 stop:19082 length:759 start_codon:yes stop_codon:yes gene_type:complete
MAVKLAGFSEPGLVRKRNEDAALIDHQVIQGNAKSDIKTFEGETRWVAVADGLGGHPAGNIASETLLRSLISDNQPFRTREDLNELSGYLSTSLLRKAQEVDGAAGMASTLTALYCSDDKLYIIHCGDCRAYRIQGTGTEKSLISTDHTLVFQDYLRGELTLEQLRMHPMKNQILRCIQATDSITRLELHTLERSAGLRILLASDGIWEAMSHPRLMELVQDGNLAQCCESVRTQYYSSGARDNGTMVLVEI